MRKQKGGAIMSYESQIDIVVQVAKKFYVDNCSQVEIAQELKLSRPTVSRLLKKAVDSGVVEIHINDTSYELLNMGQQLAQKYGLHCAIVVKSNEGYYPAVIADAAMAASNYLTSILKDQDLIGVGMGSAVFKILDYIRTKPSVAADVVQIQGNSIMNQPYAQGSYIVLEFARRLGGTAHLMHAPLSVNSKLLHSLMMEERFMQNHFRMLEKMDIALIGIGTDNLRYDNEDLCDFGTDFKPASNICNHFFDLDGKLIETEYTQHTFGVPIETLQKVPEVIAIAVGARKKDAVLSAVRSGVIKSLVTDDRIAAHLLAADNSR